MAKDKIAKAFLAITKDKFTIDTIAEMIATKHLAEGDIVRLNGYYSAGDGANHIRKISKTDDGSGILLANGLYANIVHNGEINVSWFGAKEDGVTDDTLAIQKSINYGNFEKLVQTNISFVTSEITLLKGKTYYFNQLVVDTKINTSRSVLYMEYANIDTIIELLRVSSVYCVNKDMHDFRGKKEEAILVPAFFGYYNRRTILDIVEIYGFKTKPILIKSGYETQINNIRVQSDNVDYFSDIVNKEILHPDETEYTIGIANECLDGIINNAVVIGYNIGLVVNGGNMVTNYHPWGYLQPFAIGVLLLGSKNIFTNCYLDSVVKESGYESGCFYELKKRNCRTSTHTVSFGNLYSNCFQTPLSGKIPAVFFNFGDRDTNGVGVRNQVINAISTDGLSFITYELEGEAIGLYSNYSGIGYNAKEVIMYDDLNSLITDNMSINDSFYAIIKKYINPSNTYPNISKVTIISNVVNLIKKFNQNVQNNMGWNGDKEIKLFQDKGNYIRVEIKELDQTSIGSMLFFSVWWGKSEITPSASPQIKFMPSSSIDSLIALDTPYHATQMASLGILDAYHNYLSELYEYEKTQNVPEGAMNLNIVQPPVIPKEIEEYAKEYNLL